MRNLSLLISDYRSVGRAFEGYKKLTIDRHNPEFLDNILRDHHISGITIQSEIVYRDQVDFLLKFYSLLELGILTAHLPSKLTPELNMEIIDILGTPEVRKYYKDRYPLLLPQLLFQFAKDGKPQIPVDGNDDVYNEILMLDSILDEDAENFLWMLDSGKTDGFGITDLNMLLKDKERMNNLLERPRKDEDALDKAFWGFVKFTSYMVKYEHLMKNCKDDLLRSAIWHYQSYWFKNMKVFMSERYIQAVRDIQSLNSQISFEEFALTNGFDSPSVQEKEKLEIEYVKWQKTTDEEINKIISSITFLLDQNHGTALERHYKKQIPKQQIGEWKKQEALIICESESDIFFITKALDTCGVKARGVTSASEGLTIMKEMNLSVIFLDLVMPNLDGYKFLDILSREGHELPPIVILGDERHTTLSPKIEKNPDNFIIQRPFKETQFSNIILRIQNPLE